MEAQVSDNDGESPAEYPRWVLFDQSVQNEDHDDANTVAAALTSSGHLIRVSFQLMATPAISSVCVDDPYEVGFDLRIIAAHRDCILIKVNTTEPGNTTDYFVYSAGNVAADIAETSRRQPSLLLLPQCYLSSRPDEEVGTHNEREQRYMDYRSTAVLCGGGDDTPLVAGLDVRATNRGGNNPLHGELCMFRSGEWEVKQRLPVHHDDGKGEELSYWEVTDMVVAVGDRFLYWVNLLRGIIYADVVSEKDPVLRYVSLPVKPLLRRRYDFEACPENHRRVCATGGDSSTVRFVEVAPRCCCGGPGRTSCARSRYAFTVTTWTLRMDDMHWEKDGVVDCDELWPLRGYQGLPRVRPSHPVASLEDPDVLCLVVHKNSYMSDVKGEDATWVIEVDMRRKNIRAVRNDDAFYNRGFLPSELSKYFNTLQE